MEDNGHSQTSYGGKLQGAESGNGNGILTIRVLVALWPSAVSIMC